MESPHEETLVEPLEVEVPRFDTPLVFSKTNDTSNIKNLLLVDSLVSESQLFYDSANSTTFPVIYSSDSNVNDFKNLLDTKFSNIDRISFVFHDNILNGKQFLNGQLLFTSDDLIDNTTIFSQNTQLLIDTIKKFNVKHIDFLACNSLNYPNWVKFYNLLNKQTNVVVGASNNKTGNLKYGNDWVMENTNENVVNTYFNNNIQNYTDSLDSTISQAGGIIYIRQSGTIIQYQQNNTIDDSWNDINWPVTFVNSAPANETILTVSLFTDITLNSASQYFITGSNFITYDGTGKKVTINGVANLGLINNGYSNVDGFHGITVQNISSAALGSSYLESTGGWICQSYFGRAANNIVINNCSNSGTLTAGSSGGICGAYLATQKGTASITNCSNTGAISGSNAGGICGLCAGYSGTVTFTNCSNTGLISGFFAGGICGSQPGQSANQVAGKGTVTFTNCSNTGLISGFGCGGICGSYPGFAGQASFTNCSNSGTVITNNGGGITGYAPGYGNGIVTITNCSNTGTISGGSAGGIAAYATGFSSGTVTITNCSNSGTLTAGSSGGICGQNTGWKNGIVTITNCSNSGEINANNCGGICGYTTGIENGRVTITNCSNSGLIGKNLTGGICGSNSGLTNGTVTITNCYNTGVIDCTQGGGITGGIFGNNTSKLCSIINCYNIGNINGDRSGGITGIEIGYSNNALYTGNILIENCYSLGNIARGGGGICGYVGASNYAYTNNPIVNITNCYTAYNSIVDAGSEYLTIYSLPATTRQLIIGRLKNVYTTLISNWSDSEAQSALTGTPTSLYISNPGAAWTTTQTNSPYLLSSFNAEIYNPSIISNESGQNFYTSQQGVFLNSNYNLISVNDALPTNISIDNKNGVLTFEKNEKFTKYVEKVFVSKGTAPYYYEYNFNSFTLNQLLICFKEGSKILCFNSTTNVEEYIEIEKLRKGDLVKTILHGYKPISYIGYSKMYNQVNEVRSKGKLYKCCNSEFPEVFEDLVLTGPHSILVKEFKDSERDNASEILGDIYVTDEHYRLPACVDKRTKIYEEEGVHTVWHFSLENDNYYMNYGVYANGLLVETTSNRMMKDLSGAILIE